jgi:hypothetical protein
MELRLRIRPLSRRAAFIAAFGALAVSALAGAVAPDADAAKKRKKAPVITSISPKHVAIGETLTIRGRNFIKGRSKNSVVFKRKGARAVFVKADIGTSKLLKVIVPEKLAGQLLVADGAQVETRFGLRVLARKLSKRFTRRGKAPFVGPEKPPVTTPPASAHDGDCDLDKQINGVDADDDNDLLLDTVEARLKTDGCKSDSDGDGVTDGYEYQSARDLNDDEYQDPNSWLPYPAKRPYPNALFADAAVDHDGDSLTLRDEFRLWQTYGNKGSLDGLVYSAGEAFSLSARENGTGRRRPTQAAAGYPKHVDFMSWAGAAGYDPVLLSVDAPWHDPANQDPFRLLDFNRSGGAPDALLPPVTGYTGFRRNETLYYDLDRDGYLSDDERDEDADGLTNYDETTGRMTPGYWDACYSGEAPYLVKYAGTDLTDPDSDGDGIRDGADDQDHDDIPNVMELSRNAASGHADWDTYKGLCVLDEDLLDPDGTDEDQDPDAPKVIHPEDFGRMNPYNPCLPYTWSRTCERHHAFDAKVAPFDGSTNWPSLQ